MSQILCLDFGTSSLRAALLNSTEIQKVLPIGLSVRSALDDASIRSDILLSSDGNKIYLAEEAIKSRGSQKYLLYDASPKLWLRKPEYLSKSIISGSMVTREMLLTALVAYALSACINAANLSPAEFNALDIRMSHPIWEESVASKVNTFHEKILRTAIKLAPDIKNGVISTEIFKNKNLDLINTEQNNIPKKIEVLEPIAAALTLIPNQDNTPRITIVIDIGAGTTDIGIFQIIYPDESSDKKRSLIPIGKAISLFTAGNTVDEILLKHIKSKASIKIQDDQIQDVEIRIRQIKERLFSDDIIRELDVNIKLEDFIKKPELNEMYDEIKNAIQKCLSDNYDTLEPFSRYRDINELDIVMGGGGGSLSFITVPLKSEQFNLRENILSVNLLEPNTELRTPLLGASIERLAVALGGSNYEYENLKTEHTEPIYSMRGSM